MLIQIMRKDNKNLEKKANESINLHYFIDY